MPDDTDTQAAPLCDCHGLPKVRVSKGKKKGHAWICRIKKKEKEHAGRKVHLDRIGTAPEEQPFVPIGTGAGIASKKKQEYIQPAVPLKPLPPHVDEIEPLYHTYGQWTTGGHIDGGIEMDEIVPPRDAPEGVYFDADAAQYACDKIETLYQFEGKWAGHQMSLTYFEKRLIRYVFGWKRADGTRLIRKLYLEIPRKNGKSILAACIAIYLNFWDNEQSPQVFFAALDQSQSSMGWDKARMFIQQDEDLNEASLVYVGDVKTIKTPFNNGEMRALTGKSANKFGLNLHGLVFDELMNQANRDTWDVLTTAQGAREQPLIIAITTAGFDRGSVAYEQHEYTRQIFDGTLSDPSFLGIVYGLEVEDDWTDPESWRKSVPNLGYTISYEYYESEVREALGKPRRQNALRTLYFDQWVGQAKRAINMHQFEKCEREINLEELEGRLCFGGLDLSTTTSLTAFSMCFPEYPTEKDYTFLVHHWLPDDELDQKSFESKVDYRMWAEQEWLTLIPGKVIIDEYISDYILQMREKYQIADISFDRYGMIKIYNELGTAGIDMIATGQNFVGMSYGCKQIEKMILNESMHINNPMIRWQVDNMAWVEDSKGNVMPDRLNSGSRIDGFVAMVMSADGALRRGSLYLTSAYEEHGLEWIWEEMDKANDSGT